MKPESLNAALTRNLQQSLFLTAKTLTNKHW